MKLPIPIMGVRLMAIIQKSVALLEKESLLRIKIHGIIAMCPRIIPGKRTPRGVFHKGWARVMTQATKGGWSK